MMKYLLLLSALCATIIHHTTAEEENLSFSRFLTHEDPSHVIPSNVNVDLQELTSTENTFWERQLRASSSSPPPLEPTFELTVNRGTGSGAYKEDDKIEIIADNEGVFVRWDSDATCEIAIEDTTSSTTTLSMPFCDAIVTAVFAPPTPQPTFSLTVKGGDGTGTYEEGETVNIISNQDEGFLKWEIIGNCVFDVEDTTSKSTSVTMPGCDAEIKALFVTPSPSSAPTSAPTIPPTPKPTFSLTVEGGTGTGTYQEGENVKITADKNKKFVTWEVIGNCIPDFNAITSKKTSVTMPDCDAEIRAVFATDSPTAAPSVVPTKSPIPEPLFALAVSNGKGEGDYAASIVVSIVADTPALNKVFSTWEIVKGNPTIEDPTSPETQLTMPSNDVEVKATYEDVLFQLTVKKGSGNGAYEAGTNVQIAANDAPDGKVFSKWEIKSGNPEINDPTSANTSLIMTAENTVVAATYKELPTSKPSVNPTSSPTLMPIVPATTAPPSSALTSNPSVSTFTLLVEGGTGSGEYTSGTVVTIIAMDAEVDKVFDKWVISSGSPAIVTELSPSSVLTMPAGDVTVTATYKDILYNLKVKKGSGNGDYTSGTDITITANEPQDKVFDKWVISSGNPQIADQFSPETVVTMPSEDSTVTATYKDALYNLSVDEGNGDGEYTSGTVVTIFADQPQNKLFDKWVISAGNPVIADASKPETVVTMPSEDSTVTATYKDILYNLSVNEGSGGGDYAAGTVVTITANQAPENKVFDKWVSSSPDIADVSSPETTLTMPDQDVTVTATYKNILYNLSVKKGSGGGDYAAGTVVTIIANQAPENKVFDKWVISSGNPAIVAETSSSSVLTMPAEDVTVTATYKDILFNLKVKKGSGGGEYAAGAKVTITANEAPENKVFGTWVISSGNPAIADQSSSETVLTMPAGDVIVTATYKDILYTLIVRNGDGGGDYVAGTNVDIVTKSPAADELFSGWEIVKGFPVFSDEDSTATVLTMPAGNVVVRAVFTDILYTLDVTDGTGDGDYAAGTVVDIAADTAPEFKIFSTWDVISGSPSFEDSAASSTKLTMPSDNVSIRAVYVALNDCGTTAEAREEEIMTILKGVSRKKTFNKSESPQSKAAAWLIDDDELFVCPGVNDKKLIQRYTMAVFYFSTKGEEWNECFAGDTNCGTNENDFNGKQPYLSAVNECEWAGSQECNADLCLVDITFEENNNLQGTMPEELRTLEALEVLSLETQKIGGSIPVDLGDITLLRVIDFDFNQLTGKIPESIYTLTKLEQLDLNDNQLTGTISEAVGGLSALKFIQVFANEMSGTFPEVLTNLSALRVAEFQFNNFNGVLPLCIGVQPNLVAISTDCAGPDAKTSCGVTCGCECF